MRINWTSLLVMVVCAGLAGYAVAEVVCMLGGSPALALLCSGLTGFFIGFSWKPPVFY